MTNNDLIREKIYAIIKNNVDKREQINLEATFEEIGVGSLGFVKILVDIEVQFEDEIDDDYYTGQYNSIGEFIDDITAYFSGGHDYVN